MTQEAWIIDAARTPRGIGKQGKGALAHIHPQRLASTVLKAIQERNDLNTEEVDDVIWGCSSQSGKQGACIGRMAALDAGWSTKAGGVTLDRFCGSGITSVNMGAATIMAGMEDCVVSGGVEMMSYTATLGGGLMDRGNMNLRDQHPQWHQGICADVIATLEDISQDDVNNLGYISQQRADEAIKDGRFKKSICPVYNDDGTLALDHGRVPAA